MRIPTLLFLLSNAVPSISLVFSSCGGAKVWGKRQSSRTAMFSSADGEENRLITDNMEEEMMKVVREADWSEAGYLAAAQKRNAERRESVNNASTDSDWENLAAEKAAMMGQQDDWEASLEDVDNIVAKADDDEDEPKLLIDNPDDDQELIVF